MSKIKLNQNVLKIIACVSMFIDHMGLYLFDNEPWMRIVGRLAFPLFAYFIYEGCKYTKNIFRYFMQVFSCAVLCFAVYYFAEQKVYGNILITFSFSILIMWSIKLVHNCYTIRGTLLMVLSAALLVCIDRLIRVDYGVIGALLPAFAMTADIAVGDKVKNAPLIAFFAGLVWLCAESGNYQFYSLISIVLLFLYTGERGKAKLKWFFYLFYPVHLLIIELLNRIM